MAIRYATKAGLWSDVTVWDGGVSLPDSTDDVYPNNFAITINQSITVNSFKTTALGSPVIAAGGAFTVTTAATITITAGIQITDHTSVNSALIYINAGSNPVTVNGNLTAGDSSGRDALNIMTGQTGLVTVNGNVTGGGLASSIGIRASATGTPITINGNLTGRGGRALDTSGPSTINVVGNVTGTTSNGHAVGANASGTIMNITGVLSSGSSSYAIILSGSLTLTVSGGIIATSFHAIYINAGVTLVATSPTFTGGTTYPAIEVALNGVATLRGKFYASNTQPAVVSSGALRVSGELYHSSPNSRAPINGQWTVINGEEVVMYLNTDASFPTNNGGPAISLTRYGTNGPSPADVKSGITYGAGGLTTGTLAVPPASSVAAGIAVGNTVGTAALSLADVSAVIGAHITGALGS